MPFLGLLATSHSTRLALIVAVTLIGLIGTGWLGARVAGGKTMRPTLRVLAGGAAAMAVTAAVGQLAHLSGV